MSNNKDVMKKFINEHFKINELGLPCNFKFKIFKIYPNYLQVQEKNI